MSEVVEHKKSDSGGKADGDGKGLIAKSVGVFLFALFGFSFAFAGTPIDTSDVLLLAYY